ncbi:hypothetical protein P7K49_015382 [Saguinus oedipus]|uniref:Alpha-carbonic anhydrase domain-containing protein n=1 Tax=Saguinus oedipus TaxID=9490 RepID=A0ABQ9V942_SAGOE|nr:hypothetical protein P7K49_015382 [Saguinus oedipus]
MGALLLLSRRCPMGPRPAGPGLWCGEVPAERAWPGSPFNCLSPVSEGALDEAHWPKYYPHCGGQRQSPIDLQRTKVRYNPALKGLNLTGYESQAGEFLMVNNGHTEGVKHKGQRQWLCSPSLDSELRALETE